MLKLRSLRRLKEVVGILFDYEMHHYIENLGLKMHLPIHKRFEPKKDHYTTQPETIRHIFEDLGGAFIKLGQILALRPDLIGEEYSREFEKLLIDVPPEDPVIIKGLIKDIPFKKFNTKPIGSASIAQVHKAKLGNKIVAVKIKRPNIDEKFMEDIEIMELLAKRIKEKYNPKLVDPVEIAEEFKRYTEKELNLKHEVTNIKRFYKNFKNIKDVKIPKVYDEYSTENILIMEYVEGKSILSAKTNNKGVIKKVTNAVYKMLFEDRFFHADLHPGNIFIHKGKIIFLDFGIVGHIDKDMEKKLFNLFSSLVDGKLEAASDALLDLNLSNDEPNEQYLKDGIYDLLADYYNTTLKRMDFGKIFYGTIKIAKRANLKMPAQLVLFGKSLVTMDGFCREIDPEFNVVKNAKPYVHKVLKQKISHLKIIKSIKDMTFQLSQSITQLPHGLKNLSRRFLRFEERVRDIDNTFRLLTNMLWRVSKLLTSTILFATFFVSSIILLDRPPLYAGYSLLSWIGFVVSTIFFINIIRLLTKEIKN